VARLRGKVVIDTNVLLKMFFLEEHSAKADRLLDDFELGLAQFVIPRFLMLEFVNVLWLKVREGTASHKECERVLTGFLTMAGKMQIETVEPLLYEILAYSLKHDHAAYDMAFLVLSEKLGAPFVTADEKLYSKAIARSRLPVLLRDL